MVQPFKITQPLDPSITLSVSIITYNQIGFIAQTIESVLQQKVSFKIEIIVGDDFSTDGTRELLTRYQDKFPDVVKPILHPKRNEGLPGKLNFLSTVYAAKGKYIALLDGDDYWTDPYKLEKQVQFLEAHPQYVGCYHNTEERYDEDDNLASFLYCNYTSARSISFSDLAYANLIPTCSVVYKNRLFGDYPDWFYDLKMGDWPLHLMNARFGDYWYIPKIMGVHRLHSKSYWMLQDKEKNSQSVIEAYDTMLKEFSSEPSTVKDLTIGKQAYVKPLQSQVRPKGYRHKMKSLAIRIINRL